jgi:hypothetical protein
MLVLISFIFAFFHNYHISQGQINYNSKEQKIEISLQLFIDDIELELNAKPIIKYEQKEFDNYLSKYIQKNLIIKSENQQLQLKYIGKEATKDLKSIWVYLETNKLKSIKKVEIVNTILNTFFEDQTNIIEFLKNNIQVGYYTFDRNKKNFQTQF